MQIIYELKQNQTCTTRIQDVASRMEVSMCQEMNNESWSRCMGEEEFSVPCVNNCA